MKEMTTREKRFAELWVADPEHNGAKAAREAGYAGNANSLKTTGSQVLARRHVQDYIAKLRVAAAQVAVATIQTAQEGNKAQAIATLAETLTAATAILNVDIPSIYGENGEPDFGKVQAMPVEQRRALQVESQHTTDAEGQSYARYKFKRDPVAVSAAKLLVDHYEGAKQPAGGNTYVLNIGNLTPELQRQLYLNGWLSAEPKQLTD